MLFAFACVALRELEVQTVGYVRYLLVHRMSWVDASWVMFGHGHHGHGIGIAQSQHFECMLILIADNVLTEMIAVVDCL